MTLTISFEWKSVFLLQNLVLPHGQTYFGHGD